MDDTVLEYLRADTTRRLTLMKDPDAARAIRSFLGQNAGAELEEIRSRVPDLTHLSARADPNLIFVPGVMGSLLDNEYRSGVWWIDIRTRDRLNGLALTPDGLSDIDPNDQIRAYNVDFVYEPFLSAVLARDDFGHRVFAYDWRKMYSENTKALRDLILSLHQNNGGKKVHLVAHSMGGLMVRATLKQFGNELWNLIDRIVFIGTPHYGSPSIAGYLKNHLWGWETLAVLGLYLSRETFRSLWGVLSLLPAPAGVYPGSTVGNGSTYDHPCANFDLYDVNAWGLDLKADEAAHLQNILTTVARFHTDLAMWHNDGAQLSQDYCDRMLMIAGVGYKSLFRLAYTNKLGGLWTSMDKITDREPGDPNRDGDGRVPLASAQISRVTLRYVKGVHAALPNIPAVYGDVFRWLNNEPLTSLALTPEDALGGHLSAEVETSEAPSLDRSAKASDDDPGYLQMVTAAPEDREEADKLLDSGALPDFNLTRIL